jgi:hypothetical protein
MGTDNSSNNPIFVFLLFDFFYFMQHTDADLSPVIFMTVGDS